MDHVARRIIMPREIWDRAVKLAEGTDKTPAAMVLEAIQRGLDAKRDQCE